MPQMKENRTSNKHNLLAHALTLILTKVITTKNKQKKSKIVYKTKNRTTAVY
jgi:hypothetical protein